MASQPVLIVKNYFNAQREGKDHLMRCSLALAFCPLQTEMKYAISEKERGDSCVCELAYLHLRVTTNNENLSLVI